jgi:serine/threonine-protein kinase
VLLGTAPYMSPEQARGKIIDKRTDIWAFGCVLYEMLVGRRAFGGETTTDSVAAILEREPDWTALPAATPASVRQLLARCLDKDPKRRLRDIGDARAELSDTAADDVSTPVRPSVIHSRRREYVAWSMVGLLLASLGVALLWLPRANQAPAATLVRTTIALPGNQTLATGSSSVYPLAASPDGARIAYVGEHEGLTQLYVRELSALEPKVMPGTTGATHPFFSPDGQWVAFFADGALQKVAVAGGAPIRICKTPALSVGGSWGSDNTIVFALRRAGLLRVNAAGGEPVTLPDSEPAAWPEILPDGRTVLFTTGRSAQSVIATMPLLGGPRHIVARTNDSPGDGPALLGTGDLAQVRFVPGGYLVYGQSPGNVRAVPFDPASGTLAGSVVSMVSAIERGRNGGGVYFAVSNTGVLVYASTGEQHQLVWVDRQGAEMPISTDRLAFRHPRLSPDGARVAVAINDETRRSDIWVYDAERRTKHRLTTEHHNLRPVWTPDGARITFAGPGFSERSADGSGSITALAAPSDVARYPSAWSPDGRNLLFHANDPTGNRLSVLPRGGEPHALPTGSSTSQSGQFSPDGRWIAYSSDESGRLEIYVAQFPDLGGKVAISTDGGDEPRWSGNGRELFFRQGDAVMAVSIDTAHGVRAGKAQRLFAGHYSGTGREVGFDVSADGRRFVMVKSDEASTLGQLTLVQNWLTELRARVPSGR